MDYDLIIIPSYIIYALGLQWAWQFNIIFQPLNMGFDSYCDHYIVSMINKRWIIAVLLEFNLIIPNILNFDNKPARNSDIEVLASQLRNGIHSSYYL